jgi:rRNA-processing protein FCF1
MLFALSIKRDALGMLKEEYPEYEIVISKGIIKELKRLASTKKKNGRDAKIALLMLREKDYILNKNEGYADEWIIKEASTTGALVCTNDTKLRRKLRSEGVGVVTLGIGGQFR